MPETWRVIIVLFTGGWHGGGFRGQLRDNRRAQPVLSNSNRTRVSWYGTFGSQIRSEIIIKKIIINTTVRTARYNLILFYRDPVVAWARRGRWDLSIVDGNTQEDFEIADSPGPDNETRIKSRRDPP